MQTLEIGDLFTKTKKIQYYSKQTILEYDALIIDFNYLLEHVRHESNETKNLFLKRKKDLEDFLSFKRIPIIYFTPEENEITLYVNYSTRERPRHDFFVPIPEISVESEVGNTIQIVKNTPFSEFLEKYKGFFYYRSFLKKSGGTTIAETPHTKKVLGFYTEQCVFLPPLKSDITRFEEDFLRDLLSIAKSISNSSEASELPDWANNYYLPNEEILSKEMTSTQNEIDSLIEKLKNAQDRHTDFKALKKIFTATGKELELIVERIFKEIGFEIQEVPQNRDDLIIKYDDKIAVVEIKGVSKSSGEKHATQLEKWAAIYHEEKGVFAKPILLVNSFKDTPLNERNEETFPNQMIGYSTSRNHCLMTTTQLLGLYYAVTANPNEKEKFIQSIFNCNGIYQDFKDWKQFITSN